MRREKNQMTNTIKKFLSLLTFSAVAAFMAVPAFADNLQDAQTAFLKELNMSKIVLGGANTGSGLILKHTTVAGSTGAYVTISAYTMTFYSPFGTADTNMGTAGAVTFASTLGSDTMGGLCDYINSKSGWSCTLVGFKRDDGTSRMQTQTSTDGTNNLEAAGGLNVKISVATGIRLGIVPKDSGKRIILKQCQAKTETTSDLYIYGADAKTNGSSDQFGAAVNDSTLVFQQGVASDTLAYMPSQYSIDPWQAFAPGAHVVVAAGVLGTETAQGTNNYLQCLYSER